MKAPKYWPVLLVSLSLVTVACRPAPSPTPSSIPPTSSSFSPQPSSFPTAPLPLSAYPRPPADNGLGVHWSTHLYAQSDEATSYFVSELARLNIKWVKLLNDGLTGREYDHTIDELTARGIMPVLRIYQQCNTPYDPHQLDALVRHYTAKGVVYFETYNEPNQSGEPGGWCEGDGEPQPEYLAQIWAQAARTIYQAGGYPGLPSFFAPDKKLPNWPDSFFYRFFNALRAQGNEPVLYFSWAAIHNYTINHPPTYPYDAVNQTGLPLTPAQISRHALPPERVAQMNRDRALAAILKRRPLTPADGAAWGLSAGQVEAVNRRFAAGELMGFTVDNDSTAFFHFLAYRQQFFDLFGFDIPLISTEGGATRGSAEDSRYPPVDGQTVADWTVWTADYMLTAAPDYYFAGMTWLLAQHALDYDEPVWEANAWYHNRQGDQESVVNALKNRPNLAAVRRAGPAAPRPGFNPLAAYPRPPADNGRGVHFAPTTNGLHPKVVNYFVAELRQMNIKWLKVLQNDQPQVTNPYLLEQLAQAGIEPVMRVYKPFNEPYRHLPELVTQASALGVHYFELYNEPNLAGEAGGWRDDESINVDRMVDLWLMAAHDVQAAGGYPGLPPLAGGGAVDDMQFLRQFLAGLQARGQVDMLAGAWLPVHNYFLNHPLAYPADPVNVHDVLLTQAEIAAHGLSPAQAQAINEARRRAKLPREQGGFWVGNTIDEDSNGFGKFEAYANIFYEQFGFYVPVLGTEGGAIIGAAEDPRYPPVRAQDLTILTLNAYHAMLDDAPPYFFVHMPWLLANAAGEHFDERFEQAAWYKNRQGETLPVVDALKADPRKNEVREWPAAAEQGNNP